MGPGPPLLLSTAPPQCARSTKELADVKRARSFRLRDMPGAQHELCHSRQYGNFHETVARKVGVAHVIAGVSPASGTRLHTGKAGLFLLEVIARFFGAERARLAEIGQGRLLFARSFVMDAARRTSERTLALARV